MSDTLKFEGYESYAEAVEKMNYGSELADFIRQQGRELATARQEATVYHNLWRAFVSLQNGDVTKLCGQAELREQAEQRLTRMVELLKELRRILPSFGAAWYGTTESNHLMARIDAAIAQGKK